MDENKIFDLKKKLERALQNENVEIYYSSTYNTVITIGQKDFEDNYILTLIFSRNSVLSIQLERAHGGSWDEDVSICSFFSSTSDNSKTYRIILSKEFGKHYTLCTIRDGSDFSRTFYMDKKTFFSLYRIFNIVFDILDNEGVLDYYNADYDNCIKRYSDNEDYGLENLDMYSGVGIFYDFSALDKDSFLIYRRDKGRRYIKKGLDNFIKKIEV